ncbi:MAG TPA: hypothetical protein VD884_10835 [Ohtaekwangia sp.]|nr:hypothetical protein [Ohtaekwangia sp.]
MKLYVKILSMVIGIVLLQLACYNLFGKRSIHIACMKNLKILAYDIDTLGIYSPYIELTNGERDQISRALPFKAIEFTIDRDDFSKRFRHNEKKYGAGYQIDNLNPVFADVTEHNGTLEYGEVWRSKYVWILFGWIQIQQENIGQS